MYDIFNSIFDISEDDSNDKMEYSIENVDVNDPLFTNNFVKNTSNYESYTQMLNFDIQNKCDKIFDIIQSFFETDSKNPNQHFNKIINSDRDNFEVLVNKYFSALIQHFIKIDFKNQEKCENTFSYIFIEFCEYICTDYNKVFNVLHDKFKKIIRQDLIKMINLKNFNKIENKMNQLSENTINNHKNVFFKPLI